MAVLALQKSRERGRIDHDGGPGQAAAFTSS
jgi:hypothetical protein